jgi:hypothetical protein
MRDWLDEFFGWVRVVRHRRRANNCNCRSGFRYVGLRSGRHFVFYFRCVCFEMGVLGEMKDGVLANFDCRMADDPKDFQRQCRTERRIAASSSRLFGCVIGQRLSACLAIDLPQQPTSRLPQAQPPKAG